MKELKGKNILLLAPNFFGYEFEIKKELENLGAKVFYFDERPKNDFLTKACIRLNLKSFIQKNINNYYQNIVNETKTKNFDYLFLISPETIDVEKIKKIKSLHLNIKVFIYIWDSIKNKIKIEDINSDLIRSYCVTSRTSKPDLIIRTSNEKRLSGFFLFDSYYSEFIFLEKNWPEVNASDLIDCIIEYTKREIRNGK